MGEVEAKARRKRCPLEAWKAISERVNGWRRRGNLLSGARRRCTRVLCSVLSLACNAPRRPQDGKIPKPMVRNQNASYPSGEASQQPSFQRVELALRQRVRVPKICCFHFYISSIGGLP